MHVSHVTIPFEKIAADVLGLPPNAAIVGVREHPEGTHVVLRIVADVLPADCILQPGDPLSKIGASYVPAESTGGASLGGEAEVIQGMPVTEDEAMSLRFPEPARPVQYEVDETAPTVVS